MAVGGWALMALTTAGLTFEELAEFKKGRPPSPSSDMRNAWACPGRSSRARWSWRSFWAMWIFIRKGLRAREARAPLTLGITCWVLALLHEAIDPWLFYGRARAIEFVLEETLEFSGTLLIGVSAAIVLRGGRPSPYHLFGRHCAGHSLGQSRPWPCLAAWQSSSCSARRWWRRLPRTRGAGAFGVSLQRHEALVQ